MITQAVILYILADSYPIRPYNTCMYIQNLFASLLLAVRRPVSLMDKIPSFVLLLKIFIT